VPKKETWRNGRMKKEMEEKNIKGKCKKTRPEKSKIF
jgi:hypothetical protein